MGGERAGDPCHRAEAGSLEQQSLDTPRLVLRDFIDEDRPDVHALRSDPEVARFMDYAPESPEQSQDWSRVQTLGARRESTPGRRAQASGSVAGGWTVRRRTKLTIIISPAKMNVAR